MLATLKVHSAFCKHFDQLEYKVDANTYADFVPYLSAMHPRFRNYMLQIDTQEADESFCFLDKDLNIIDEQALFIKRVSDDEVVYLVPAITGGGGKRGFLLFAMIAAAFVVAPAIMAAGQSSLMASGMAAGLPPSVAGAQAAAAGTGAKLFAGAKSIAGAMGGMNSFAMRIVGNVALSIISRLFAPKPKTTERDSSTRDNNMFGSLVNSITSGTPVPLVYGHMRIGGQMISGYLDAEIHGKTDIISVGDKFD